MRFCGEPRFAYLTNIVKQLRGKEKVFFTLGCLGKFTNNAYMFEKPFKCP